MTTYNVNSTYTINAAADLVAGDVYQGVGPTNQLDLNFSTPPGASYIDFSGIILNNIQSIIANYNQFGMQSSFKLTIAQLEALTSIDGGIYLADGGTLTLTAPFMTPGFGYTQTINLSDNNTTVDLSAVTSGQWNILCGAGTDVVRASAGANSFFGGSGTDTYFGGSGTDYIVCRTGATTVNAGSGASSIYLGSGLDKIYGGAGDDAIFITNTYSDSLGNSAINSGDIIIGGSGANSLNIGATSGVVDLTGVQFSNIQTLSNPYGSTVKLTVAQLSGFQTISGGSIDIVGSGAISLTGVALTNGVTFSPNSAITSLNLSGATGSNLYGVGVIINLPNSAFTLTLGSAAAQVDVGTGNYTVFGGTGNETLSFQPNGSATTQTFTGTYIGGTGSNAVNFSSSGIIVGNGAVFDISQTNLTGFTSLTAPENDTVVMTAAQLAGFTNTMAASYVTLTTGGTINLAGVSSGIYGSTSFQLSNAATTLDLRGFSQGLAVVHAGAGNDVIYGMTSSTYYISPGEYINTLYGGAGNDTFKGSTGSDYLSGGGGINTAIYTGNLANYRFTETAGGGAAYTLADQRSGTNDGTDTLANIQILQFADTTLNLTAPVITLTTGGQTMFLLSGQTFDLSNTAGIADTVGGNNGTVNLTNADAAVNGNGDTVNINSGGAHVSVMGGQDTVFANGSGDTLSVGGNGQGGLADTVVLNGSGDNVTELSGAAVIFNGNGQTVAVGQSDNLGLFGANDTANFSGAGDGAWVGLNGQGGAADTLNFAQGGFVSEASNSAIIVNGSGVYVSAGQSDNLGLFGAGDTASFTGAGAGVWVGGNGQSGAANTLNFTQGGGVTEYANAAVIINGNNVNVSAGPSDNLGLFGANDTANLAGTGDGVWVGLNGQGGVADTLNFAATGYVSEASNSAIIVNGNGVYVSAGQSANLGLFGAGDTAALSGAGDGVWVSGTADTLNFAATGYVSEGSSSAITVNGNGVYVAVSQSDNLGLFGANDTAALSGVGDNVWVGGNGQSGGVDTLNFTSGGGVSQGANANLAVNGAGVTIVTAHNDTLALNGANDTVVITSGFGSEVIAGFQAGGANHDTLQISTNIFADWAHLLGATKQQGSDLIITLDASDTITLKGLTLTAGRTNSFTSADAHFG